MNNYFISRATESDVSQIVKLVNSVYRGETGMKSWTTEAHFIDGQRTDESSMLEIIKKPQVHLMLLKNKENKLVGCVHLEKMEENCYFSMFSIDVNEQKKV